MAKCWICQAQSGLGRFTCPNCREVEEIKSLQKEASELRQVQERAFEMLSNSLQGVASVVEWGFQEMAWELAQQTDVLRSIDRTLKTPSETQANEWRQMAEELRRRGVLDESEKLFLNALESNPLDYRIYVGLAETYLRMERFDKAKIFLEKSLPHAPKEKIDYRSYSYRLIGHIYACNEDYSQAVSVLQSAIELSPSYQEAIYDHAQYCAQKRDKENCLLSLKNAIMGVSFYFYLTQKERNFEPLSFDVKNLLRQISTDALDKAKTAISKLEGELVDAQKGIREAQKALKKCIDKTVLSSSITKYEEAKSELNRAKDKVASGDYRAFLEAELIAKEAHDLANYAKNEANEKRSHYEKTRSKRVKNALATIPISMLVLIFAGWGGGYLVGAALGVIVGSLLEHSKTGVDVGSLMGVLGGCTMALIYGISKFRKALHKYN